MTSISWVILLHGEEQFVSADAGYQGAPQREELAEVDVDWLDRRASRQVKPLKQHPRKNKTAINIEYESQHPCQGGAPVSHHQTAPASGKPDTRGCFENDNQLAMLFTPANLFQVDQMIRQWERSR